MSGRSQRERKVTGVGVTKKAQARKNLQRSLRWSHDQSDTVWSRQVHIVMEPVAATGSVGNQNWYFVRGTKGGPLVSAGGVGGAV